MKVKNMVTADFDDASRQIKRIHRRIKSELEGFSRKIYAKNYGLIFDSHKYSQDELYESPELGKLKSMCAKLHDDIDNWCQRSKFSSSEEEELNEQIDDIKSDVRNIEYEIENREPLFWERLGGFVQTTLNSFQLLPHIGKHVPLLGNFFSNVEKLLGIVTSSQKRLK